MEWIEDRSPFDGRSVVTALAGAIGITVALIAFVTLVLAGVVTWMAGVAGI